MESRHGYFTRMPGFRTTPRSTFAPKQRRINRRTEENGSNCQRTIGDPTKNHIALAATLRPGEYQELSYENKSGWGKTSSSKLTSAHSWVADHCQESSRTHASFGRQCAATGTALQ